MSHSTLHICHTVFSLDVGGLEKIVIEMTLESIRRGHRVSIICLERPGKLAKLLESSEATIHCLNKQSTESLVQQAQKLLSEFKPDIVHGHQIGATWHVGRAARSLQIPIVHTEHGNALARTSSLIEAIKLRYLIYRCGRMADQFCCVSEEIARSVQKYRVVARSKCRVVQNGIATDLLVEPATRESIRTGWNIPSDALLVGTVGRLAEVKRQDRLIRAVAQLKSKHPQIHLIIIGDGSLLESLQRLALESGIPDRVILPGYLPNPGQLMHAFDIFAMSSRSEGLPMSLLEAWYAGVPIVSTAVGAIPDTVQNGRDGLLVSESSEPELITAIDRLLSNPEERQAMGQAGREKVLASYTLKKMVDDYELIYRNSLNGTR